MGFGIMPGMTGVLVTCNKGKEAQCVKEMYDLLSVYLDNMSDHTEQPTGQELEDALRQEVNELKSTKNKKFLSIGVGKDIGCLAFIKLSPELEPVQVVSDILRDKQVRCIRSTQRLVPLQAICYANINDFTKMAKQVLKEHFKDTVSVCKTFAVVIESRMNSSLNKRVIIELVGDLMAGTGYAVNLKTPDVVIMVQVLKNIVGVSVIPDYYSLHRMNIQTVCDQQLPSV